MWINEGNEGYENGQRRKERSDALEEDVPASAPA
jgi:hypothetical protein